MACQTWIYAGSCPYGDRCTFIHDTALSSSHFQARPLKSAAMKPAAVKDTFYWPDMNKFEVRRSVDSSGLPNSNQSYSIPSDFAKNDASIHDRAIYSIWNHFVSTFTADHFLQKLAATSAAPGSTPTFFNAPYRSSSSLLPQLTPISSPKPSTTYLGSLYSNILSLPQVATAPPLPALSRLNDCLSTSNHHIPHMKRLPVLVELSRGLAPFETAAATMEINDIADLCGMMCARGTAFCQ